jgi:hypothetical protein
MQDAALFFLKRSGSSSSSSNAMGICEFHNMELGLPLLVSDSTTCHQVEGAIGVLPEESCYSVSQITHQDAATSLLIDDSDEWEDGFSLQEVGESKTKDYHATSTTLSSRCKEAVTFLVTDFRAWAIHWLVFIQFDLYLAHCKESLVLKQWLVVNYAILVFLGVSCMYQCSHQNFCRLLRFYKEPSPWVVATCPTCSLLVPELLLNLTVLIACCTPGRRPGEAFFILTVPTIILATVTVMLGVLARVFNKRNILIPDVSGD